MFVLIADAKTGWELGLIIGCEERFMIDTDYPLAKSLRWLSPPSGAGCSCLWKDRGASLNRMAQIYPTLMTNSEKLM